METGSKCPLRKTKREINVSLDDAVVGLTTNLGLAAGRATRWDVRFDYDQGRDGQGRGRVITSRPSKPVSFES